MCEHLSLEKSSIDRYTYLYKRCGNWTSLKICPHHTQESVKLTGCRAEASHESKNYICGRGGDVDICPFHESYEDEISQINKTVLMVIIFMFTFACGSYICLIAGQDFVAGMLAMCIFPLSFASWMAIHFKRKEIRFCLHTSANTFSSYRCCNPVEPTSLYCHLHCAHTTVRNMCMHHLSESGDELGIKICGVTPENPSAQYCDMHMTERANTEQRRGWMTLGKMLGLLVLSGIFVLLWKILNRWDNNPNVSSFTMLAFIAATLFSTVVCGLFSYFELHSYVMRNYPKSF